VEGKNMIRISTEKVIERGNASRRITDLQARRQEYLPLKYTDHSGEARAWLTDDGWSIYNPQTGGYFLTIGEVYPEKDFQKAVEHLREAASHLREINKATATLEETWHGQETIVI
jgi:hypothetical protein